MFTVVDMKDSYWHSRHCIHVIVAVKDEEHDGILHKLMQHAHS